MLVFALHVSDSASAASERGRDEARVYNVGVRTISCLVRGSALWISRATNLPVERVSVTTTSLVGQSAPLVDRATTTWSHWNDAALQIPSVPAA